MSTIELGHLCMGCMAEKGDAQSCPICGWVEGTPPDLPTQLLPRTVISEKYLIGRVLGQGGFGITYLAWDLLLSRKLAIKEYFPREICDRGRDEISVQPLSQRAQHDYEYGLTKFVEEGRNLARFRDYPGIVSLLDFFEANGTAYIVMAYMEGMTFKQYLEEQGGKITFQQAVSIMNPVMDALREVHRVGMLHRDISPDNIYLNRDHQVKILDFGATRYAMRDRSQQLTVMIKPGYAPLEQYSSGGKQGPWTDVYAVGATFYRALTGKPPSEAPDRLASDDLIAPSKMSISIPPPSETALLKSLAVQWQSRFQAMDELQQSIVPARRESDAGLVSPIPPAPRHWLLIAAIGVLLLATLGLAAMWISAHGDLKSTQAQLQAAHSELAADEQKIQYLTDHQSVDSKAFADLNAAQKQLQDQNNQLRAQLQAASTNLNAVQGERDGLKNQVSSLTQQLHDLQAKQVNPPTRLRLSEFEFFFSNAQGQRLGNPSFSFSSNSLTYMYCQLAGPNPMPGHQALSLEIQVKVITPDGTPKWVLRPTARASNGQVSWSAFAFWGKAEPGSFARGQWTVEVWQSGDRIESRTFQVN